MTEPEICPVCGKPLAFRRASIGRAWWMTPACHVESVDEQGSRTVDERKVPA